MAISKTQRWLDLIALLVKRRFPVPVDELMEGVPAYREKWRTGDAKDHAAVRRMFERDKDELRSAGIPIETVEYSIEHGMEEAIGYRLAERDFYLPYLRIVGRSATGAGGDERAESLEIPAEEARTAMEALRRVAELPASPFAREARSALAKLTFDEHGARDAGEGAELLAREDAVVYAAPGTPGTGETLRLLTDAVRQRQRVRFTYHGIARGEATERDVAPYGLLYQHGHWYLIGHDATRDAIRVFRLGRMEPPATSGSGDAAEYEIPAEFSIGDYARREPWELGDDEPVGVDVRFDFPLALWAERNRQGEPVRELTGGAVVRRFRVRQPQPFLRWLQSFGGDAIVLAPAELRRAQARLAEETLAAYGRGTGSDG